MNTFLKKNISSTELEIYNLYVQRIMKHYDLRLTHFKIYFGFQSGLSAIVGYLIKPYIANYQKGINLSLSVTFIFLVLGVIGVLFSVAWMLVTRNDRTIQLLINDVIGNMEKEVFKNQNLAIYIRINDFYSPSKKIGFDIIDINSYVALIFLVAWIAFIGTIIFTMF